MRQNSAFQSLLGDLQSLRDLVGDIDAADHDADTDSRELPAPSEGAAAEDTGTPPPLLATVLENEADDDMDCSEENEEQNNVGELTVDGQHAEPASELVGLLSDFKTCRFVAY